MNKERRGQIRKIIAKIEDAKMSLEEVCSDEEYAYDNMPENLQSSLRGETSENAIDQMGGAVELLEQVLDCLNEVML